MWEFRGRKEKGGHDVIKISKPKNVRKWMNSFFFLKERTLMEDWGLQ